MTTASHSRFCMLTGTADMSEINHDMDADRRDGVAMSGLRVDLTVRHYCQGIGDSHLLFFPRPDGTSFKMLIDCGLHTIVSGGTETIDRVARDIKAAAGDHIDVLVVTHEHWDHVSGFHTAREIFQTMEFGQVWMPWTENPADPMAIQLDTHRRQALGALQRVTNALSGRRGLSARLSGMRDRLEALDGFYFGAKGDKVRAARDAAAQMASPSMPLYLDPGGKPLQVPGLPGVNVYVLGPPRDRAMLRLEERKAEMYQLGARAGWRLEQALSSSFGLDSSEGDDWVESMSPFAESLGHDLNIALHGGGDPSIAKLVSDYYSGTAVRNDDADSDTRMVDQDWRRIDADWMAIAADLALQLDQGINNTSLVLAFEFVDTGRVVLFPGDAQIGSWLSWHSVNWDNSPVTVADLLARTVYLKVAHHGSHNATPKGQGLELMTHPDLSAFVPVNEMDARKAKWHQMPFGTIMDTLNRRTSGRTFRADEGWVAEPDGKPAFQVPSGSIVDLRNKGEGWVEVDIA